MRKGLLAFTLLARSRQRRRAEPRRLPATLPLLIGQGGGAAGGGSYSVPIQTLLFFTALWASCRR